MLYSPSVYRSYPIAIMSKQPPAGSASTSAASGGGVGPSRRTWDKDAFERKAVSREKRQAELDSVNAERRSQGLAPLKRLKSHAPEPELAMQQRRAPLELEKNQGKTLMVDLSSGDGKGQTGPGFYCEVCRKLLKDNLAYLDHINGRIHLMRIGQSTQQDRATLEDVQEMLDKLRKEKLGTGEDAGGAMKYDFDERIRKIAEQEEKEREDKRAKRRQQKQLKKETARMAANGDSLGAGENDESEAAMMAAMGFGGFGSTKKH